jgi:uncharacterized PurR-regulated membrane protein YhhQ (DUF165 family)
MTRLPAIHAAWLRGLCSFILSSIVSLVVFVIIGFYVPGRLMEVIWGPWEDQPIGSGLILLMIAFPIGLLCLLGCALLTRKFYLWLSPPASTPQTTGTHID